MHTGTSTMAMNHAWTVLPRINKSTGWLHVAMCGCDLHSSTSKDDGTCLFCMIDLELSLML